MRKYFLKALLFYVFLLLAGFGQKYSQFWDMYSANEFKKLKVLIEKELKLFPENTELNTIMGRILTGYQEYEKAEKFFNRVLLNYNAKNYERAWALNYLGKCYYGLSKYEDSERCFKECVRMKATRNATSSSERFIKKMGFHEFYQEWKQIETEHFIFHIQKETKIIDLKKYTDEREAAFNNINDFFKSNIPKKIDYFIWNSTEEAEKVIGKPLGFANSGLCYIHSGFKQTVGHEMTHVISHYCTEIEYKTSLINEGTAVCFDQTRENKFELAKKRLGEEGISVIPLWQNLQVLPGRISYPLFGAFVKAIIDKFGKEKFLLFFKDQSYENAKVVFGEELEELIVEFEKSLNES